MSVLTLTTAAPLMGINNGDQKKDVRAMRRVIRLDPTCPFAKKGNRWLAVEVDFLEWIRRDYTDAAKQLLQEGVCINDGIQKPGSGTGTGTSALQVIESHLGPRTRRKRARSSTSSTPRLGIAATGS